MLTNLRDTHAPLRDIDSYMNNCKLKIDYHRINAKNSNSWNNFLGIFQVLLTAGSALMTTCLAVFKTEESTVLITSACFSCAIAIFSRVQTSYSFNLLTLLHHSAFDDYSELLRDFSMLDPENFDENIYKLHVHRYTSIIEKSHHMPVRSCIFLDCFC